MTASPTTEAGGFLQERIALFARVGFFITGAFYVVTHLALTLRPGYTWRSWVDADSMLNLASTAVLGVAWRVAAGPPRPVRTLGMLDLGGSFLACLPAAWLMLLPEAGPDHKYRMLLAITNALIARAAVVPTPPGWTLRVSATAAAPAVLLVGAYHNRPDRFESLAATSLHTIVALLWCAVAVAIATVTSHVIYGLRQEVRAARQLGQYTLLEKVGQGGMGEVYRARHALLRRPTAIKLLPPGRAGEDALRRFEREVQLTAILTHPNTVAVYDYGRTPDGIFYYAMEYLEGLNLEQLVREHGPQPPGRVVHILRQLLGALAEAHGVGLIHRDVKPANVFLCQRGGHFDVAKVLDFGLVREMGGSPEITGEESVTGTPLFLSPEALTDPASVDVRSDLYGVGGVAYFLLAGRHVFDGRTLVEVLSHHLHTAPVPPSRRLERALPADLEAVVLDCLAKDPSARPQTARDLEERLAGCADAGTWSAEDARAWWARHARPAASPSPAAPADLGISSAITIDLRGRRGEGPAGLRGEGKR
jgi:eukaryotic-like serine/threonine-protein kinase